VTYEQTERQTDGQTDRQTDDEEAIPAVRRSDTKRGVGGGSVTLLAIGHYRL